MMLPTLPTVPAEVSRAATAELRKITAVRSGWLLPPVLAAVAFVVASASAVRGSGPQPHEALATGTATVGLYLAIAVAVGAAAIGGAVTAGDEYRYRSMGLTALFTPDRDVLFGAKAGVTAIYSLVLAACAEVGAAVGLLAFGRHTVEFGWRLVGVFGGGLLAAVCWGVIGVGLGLLVRSPNLAVIAIAGWLFILEPLIWLVAKGAGIAGVVVLLPGSATIGTVAVGSFPESPFLPPNAASAVVLVIWAVGAGAAGWWYLRTRDI
ncbi:ABC transporter permease [Nocardia sp. MDA0666]|uniref:ABC transporter permease n=1 Tax=Nocardia sp. MDA0666 TaxID=2135448 RepID=UPI001E46F6A3|nr:ABC transporter permease [Nocardia sp. MDA0666]